MGLLVSLEPQPFAFLISCPAGNFVDSDVETLKANTEVVLVEEDSVGSTFDSQRV